MSSSHRRIIVRQRAPKRNRTLRLSMLFAACAMIPVAYLLIQSVNSPTRERLDDQLRQAESAIRESEDLLEKFTFHERRLLSMTGNSRLCRLPVLVQGRSMYITVDASALEEVSNSLALDDILIKHRKLPGAFRSGDAAEWNSALIEICRESKNHLTTVELPAIQKRMEEIRQDKAILESRQAYLREKIAKAH